MLPLRDVVKEFTTLAQFCDEETNAISLPGFVQLDNIWVVQSAQDTDLILEGLVVGNLSFLHSLHSYLCPSLLIFGEVNSAVSSRSQFFLKKVLLLDVALS